jgi:UDP-3-O-[3-hydroxymyristoyl] glucosamine N-acyltransferase
MPGDAPRYTAAELAERHGLALRGAVVTGVATLASAGPGQLAFLANPRYRGQLATTRAAVVVLREADADGFAGTALVAPDPYAAFAKLSALFEVRPARAPGVHPSADIHPSASIDPSASIAAHVSVGANSRIGANARVGAGSVVGEDCVVGDHSELVARVVLVRRVRLGARVLVHPGAVLGADGFGIALERPPGGEAHWVKVPQLGGVLVGDDCEIGANTAIDRGALDDTVLEHDVRLDNQIQVGHNVRIGAHTAIAGCTAIAGSARIGRYCLIGGAVGIAGHIDICDRVTITAMSLVTASIREPGEYSSGMPLMDSRAWRRNAARFRHLDALARKVAVRDKGEE